MNITINAKPEVKPQFEPFIEPLRCMLLRLSKEYQFTLPEHLLLRPLQLRKSSRPPEDRGLTLARASWSYEQGYCITLNMQSFTAYKKLTHWVLAEEAAHIAEAIISGKWSPGKFFQELHAFAEETYVKAF